MGLLVSGSGPWGPQGPAVTWGTDMIMGSGPRLRTCVELVDHGVDADGHAPATTDGYDGARAPFDPWPPSEHLAEALEA